MLSYDKSGDLLELKNRTTGRYIRKSHFYLEINWKQKNINHTIFIPSEYSMKLFDINTTLNGKNFSFDWYNRSFSPHFNYKSINLNLVKKAFMDKIRVYNSAHLLVTDREERIQLMAKELLFCKRKKELKECIKNFRKKRAKRIMEEGKKYLIPDICNMIVEMVQR